MSVPAGGLSAGMGASTLGEGHVSLSEAHGPI
jgi:hypothetical protein